ncbi:hypothetical protein [Streptomyces sp. AK04-3B]|uniref:hypothetical protein n=1 Tax=unclassified Streptomyces TaxID=2593676 RepID=UPI0029A360A5|nr:hypothetical protein [Streptomyces sp. AK04-3B]MDX3804266.1 hypothetical protein [Streptomyces sp. AK04-3B]
MSRSWLGGATEQGVVASAEIGGELHRYFIDRDLAGEQPALPASELATVTAAVGSYQSIRDDSYGIGSNVAVFQRPSSSHTEAVPTAVRQS